MFINRECMKIDASTSETGRSRTVGCISSLEEGKALKQNDLLVLPYLRSIFGKNLLPR